MKKTLLVLAAGVGSRYGGLKQIEPVGPNGEYLIDYSIYDAYKAGFDKVVFVIRRDFVTEFKRHFPPRKFKNKLKIEYAYQDLNDLPLGVKLPEERTKPWGTGHAVLAARNFIKEPFAVINADDFYGREAFAVLGEKLDQLAKDSSNQYFMVGYRLGKTLSENGWVSRGLCKVDYKNRLVSIYEHTKVGYLKKRIVSQDKKGRNHTLDEKRLVSMTLFGFTPDFFEYLQNDFTKFLEENLTVPKMEFFTPNVVNHLVQDKVVTMQVLPTRARWFGVTYSQDRDEVIKEISSLLKKGVYPAKLW
ncbi:MAG: NTP transferase domain-containing protein [bacterium]|nr:NTP transferase domain-containing protein [bacterium]